MPVPRVVVSSRIEIQWHLGPGGPRRLEEHPRLVDHPTFFAAHVVTGIVTVMVPEGSGADDRASEPFQAVTGGTGGGETPIAVTDDYHRDFSPTPRWLFTEGRTTSAIGSVMKRRSARFSRSWVDTRAEDAFGLFHCATAEGRSRPPVHTSLSRMTTRWMMETEGARMTETFRLPGIRREVIGRRV